MQNIRQSFWDKIPLITAIVLIASIIAAYLCYRILIKPIIYLSKVSKRLAKLDFTWRCNTRRKDELGVLAVSLESMSRNLQRTLDELKMKSEELEKDIVIIKNMERQRKSFFAAVSHELKTPITIMKHNQKICCIGSETMQIEINIYRKIYLYWMKWKNWLKRLY